MKVERLNPDCIPCLLEKYLNKFPENTDNSKKIEYMKEIMKIVVEAPPTESAPEIVEKFTQVRKRMFGIKDDFEQIKEYFNSMMLSLIPSLTEKVNNSENPLLLSMQYALVGNYIDFGAMNNVDEKKLNEFLNNAHNIKIDKTEFDNFNKDLKTAKNLVYLTDNCGEIVMDKLFINTISKLYPALNITVIVRGMPVLNDATIKDANQTGLDKIVNVTDNGTAIAGTSLDKISKESRKIIDNADIIISKGQGNFETLRFCGKNIYYLFMCKCHLFSDRFNVEPYTGMLVNDIRMKQI